MERETAFVELKTSREAFSDLLTKEMTKETNEIAEKSEWNTLVTGWREAEEHAAEIEARNNKISRLIAEGQLKHAAEVEEEAAVKLAFKEAENTAAVVAEKDLAAAEKGIVANARKAARKVKRAARTAGKKAKAVGTAVGKHGILRDELDLPVSMLNCQQSFIEGVLKGLVNPLADVPDAYKILPMCREDSDPKPDPVADTDPQIPPGGQEDRQQPMLNPDLWGSTVEMEAVPLVGSNVYLLLGVAGVFVIVLGTVAYTRR